MYFLNRSLKGLRMIHDHIGQKASFPNSPIFLPFFAASNTLQVASQSINTATTQCGAYIYLGGQGAAESDELCQAYWSHKTT